MPKLDDFIFGEGGGREPGKRFELDDFLLEVEATPQTAPQGPVNVFPQQQQAQDPRELLAATSPAGQSLEAGLIAAGETTTGALNQFAPPRLQALQQAQRPSTEALREEFPVATLAGDVLPALTVPGGGVVGGAAAGALIADDPVTGALFGGAGGALGVLGSRVLMRSLTPFPRGIGAGISRQGKNLAKKLGVKTSLGDRTANKALKNSESAIRRNPLASGPFDTIDAANKKAFNRAALKSIGAKGDRITDRVLESSRQTLSDGFERVGKSVKRIRVGDTFDEGIRALRTEAGLSLSDNSVGIVERNIDEVFATLGRAPDGRALVSLSSTLGKRAIRLSKPGSVATDAGDALFDLKDLVDDLLVSNAPAGTRKKLTDLREAWGNLRILRNRNVVVAGDVNPGAVRSALQSKQEDAFRLGGREDNPLFQMARLHEEVRELIPNSGTPTGQAFDPGNILTSIPQRAAADLLTNPTFRFLAGNNLIPAGVQRGIERAAGRAGAISAVDALE